MVYKVYILDGAWQWIATCLVKSDAELIAKEYKENAYETKVERKLT